MKLFTTVALVGVLAASASAGILVSSQGDSNPTATNFVDDGVISSGEYSAVYTGGGTGFGGTLGSGAIYMDSDGVNLYIGFAPGATVNDNFVLHLDTRA